MIRTKEKLLRKQHVLSFELKLVNEKLNEIEEKKPSDEPKKLSARQLQFRRDDALTLCKKYFNKNYAAYKSQIFDEIKKKFENVKKRKANTDKIYKIFESFFEKLKAEKETEKFYVETDELF